jgi:hypothetical protein
MNIKKYTEAARRGLSVLLICCLMAVLLVTTAPPVSAADGPVVTRNLPDTVLAGEQFEVTVQFTASGDDFTAAVDDYAPAGWAVSSDDEWCTPDGGQDTATGNQFSIMWLAAFSSGTNFNLKYKVTVPGGATPGIYDFSGGQLGYSIEGGGISYVGITGDYQVEILPSYTLTLSSSEGGEVDKPGEGVFSYLEGTVVSLKADADNGYDFHSWQGGVCTVADVYDSSTTVTMDDNYVISANFTPEPPEPPYLSVAKSVNPASIWEAGSGLGNEESTITLTVTGEGEATEIGGLDVMLAIDCSGIMGWNDPEGFRKTGAKAFVDKLDDSRDQAGMVGFDHAVELELGLTDDFEEVKDKIDECGDWGGTNFEVPLARCIDLLDTGKQAGSTQFIVFLSDGSDTYTGTATAEAKSKGYIIFSIGLGEGVAEAALQDMADETGGNYHHASNAEDVEAVFEDIAGEISGVAGSAVVVTDVLQDYINLEENFTIEPDDITENGDGTTTLVWELGIVAIGEEWTVSFDVSSDKCGRVLANVVDESMVTYNTVENGLEGAEGEEVEVLFPRTYLTVRCLEEEEKEPAEMNIQSIYVDPEEVVQNQVVEVWVSVGNSGGTRGTKTVSLYINGALEQSQTVGVGPGGGENVLFEVSRAVPGTYTVSVEGREAQFTVLGMGPPQAAPMPPQASAGFGGGLGTGGIIAIIVVVVALAIGLVVILRRGPA